MADRYFAWCPNCGSRRIDGDDYSENQCDDDGNWWNYRCYNCGMFWDREDFYYDYRRRDYVPSN